MRTTNRSYTVRELPTSDRLDEVQTHAFGTAQTRGDLATLGEQHASEASPNEVGLQSGAALATRCRLGERDRNVCFGGRQAVHFMCFKERARTW